jgi:hypothetical protein
MGVPLVPSDMRKKRRKLANGGYFDLGAATILWANTGLVWRFKPSGPFKGGERYTHVLFLTSNGSYVVKDFEGPYSAPRQWYEQVTQAEAYVWLVSHAPRAASRLFPDEHAAGVGER